MIDELGTILLAVAIGGSIAMLAWYALGAIADLIDAREDDEPDTDEKEPR